MQRTSSGLWLTAENFPGCAIYALAIESCGHRDCVAVLARHASGEMESEEECSCKFTSLAMAMVTSL